MKRKQLFILMLFLVMLVLLPLAVMAQSPRSAAEDSAETQLEQAIALAVEQEAAAPPQTAIVALAPQNVEYPLLVGVDDATIPAYQIDPITNNMIQAFIGAQVWGAAFDEVNNLVYFNSGATLYEWPVGGTINQLGTIVDGGGNTQSMVGLAFYNGVLYGTKNIDNEAIWAIDPNTLVATVHIDYVDADLDCGGFAADPNTGTFYCANDDATPHGAGLLIINPDASVTFVAPYPDGQTDIDGLAISDDGFAYLVIDEPGFIYVYDLVGGTYTTPLNNPWTTSEVFSGATWIWERSLAVCNINPITIPSSGAATLYPSTINVSEYSPSIADVNVHLLGLSHTWPDDIDILLVGPQGENLIIMSDAGGGGGLSNINLTFDDDAPGPLPDSGLITSGVYQPTNYEPGDTFPAPAPAPSAATTLATFNNTDPNGSWSLYVVDDTGDNSGQIARGWCLEITVPPPAIVVDPAELSQTQGLDSQATLTLTISNEGDGDLEWAIGEATAVSNPFIPSIAPQIAPAQPGIATASTMTEFSAYATAGLPLPEVAPNPPLSSLTGVASGGVIYYGDRAIFDAVFPGLPVEGFEAGLWGDGVVLGCPAPFNALTDNACFAPGGILPGISFQDNPLNEIGGGSLNGLAGVGVGASGALSKNIVANTFSDSFEITFDPPVNAAGMDLVHYTTDGVVVSITLYDASDVQIGATSAIAGNAGPFWGVYSATPIGRINILSTLSSGDGAEGVDNIAFGQIGACSPPMDVPWISVDPITGTVASGAAVDLDVTFDSTGLTTGVYTGTLCITSNDPLRPLVETPLTMTVATYDVVLSGDQAASGEVGTTVTYTIQITNAGSVADAFDLTATGGAWTTTLGSSSVTLAAGASASVVVQVVVPVNAADGDSDVVTITAVSQSDPGASDALTLTTTAVVSMRHLYLPMIIKP